NVAGLDPPAIRIQSEDGAEPFLGTGARAFEELRYAEGQGLISFWIDLAECGWDDLAVERFVEVRRDAQHRRHPLDEAPRQGTRIPAGGGARLGIFRLGLIDHHHDGIAR